MDLSLYLAYSGLRSEMRSVDVVANNLANVNTNGFREDRSFVAALEAVGNVDPQLEGSAPSMNPGPRVATGRDLDVAIDGEGFLVVQTPAGKRYTRDGALGRNDEGTLVTRDGAAVLGDGSSITLPPGRVNIDGGGRVSVDGAQVGQISIVKVNAAALTREGQGLYRLDTGEEEPAPDVALRQGFLERSNVDPIRASTELVDAARRFDALTRSIYVVMNSLNRRMIDSVKS